MLAIAAIKEKFPLLEHRDDSVVALHLFSEADIVPPYIAWLNNPEVVKYSDQRFKVHTFATCHQYYKRLQESRDALFIAIKDAKTQQLLGTSGLSLNYQHLTADISLLIGNEYWGQGIGLRAWRLLMNFLLQECGLRKVTGGTLSCNHGMLSIMKKTGMQPDGVRCQQQLVNGQAYDILHFSQFRSDD
jgi:RimJ/RimL family protein N-acetyltransferase